MSEANKVEEKLSFLKSIEGVDFLSRTRDAEDRCARESLNRLNDLGERAPKCYTQLGRSLAVLDSLASCFFGCPGGDHTIEYLAGRILTTSLAGLRLSLHGSYDESLALARNAGEIVNLFTLFCADGGSFAIWRNSHDATRKKSFSAVKVRCALEERRKPIPISQERYAWLCDGIAHGTPRTRPQSHNLLGLPMVGGHFQEAGFLLCLNEISIVLAFAVPLTAKLVDAPDSVRSFAKSVALELELHVGGVMATTIDKDWEEARKNLRRDKIPEVMRRSEPE